MLSVLLLITASFTIASLLIVGQRLRQQVRSDFSSELNRSLVIFQNVESERLTALAREDLLLADLPSLKALLTTEDDRTIEDGGGEFWKTSGDDMFALADPNLRVRAAFTRALPANEGSRRDLSEALLHEGKHYFVSEGQIFRFAVAPIYFGNAASGTLLGYVVNGDLIDTAYQTHLSGEVGANVTFLTGKTMLGSSTALPRAAQLLRTIQPGSMKTLVVDGHRSMAMSRDLSYESTVPLLLIFFKSLQGPDQEIHEISRLLLLCGIVLVVLGSLAMMLVADRLTRPLENLARKVRQFGSGQILTSGQPEGTREIRQLAVDFAAMQKQIEFSNRARLESERLATIGSMASSVSHDLRHYLASIYANAEFLATPGTPDAERAEFFRDIQSAVLGTTEMLESLMIFSRTGKGVQHKPESLEALAERAMEQVRMHPNTVGVAISLTSKARATNVAADGKQMERALYNLLLNACQSAAARPGAPLVTIEIASHDTEVSVLVADNGTGVPLTVARTLFEPFVSEGKQNGTGLGLTLCRCIAEEHHGRVQLVSSEPGATIFELTLPRLADPMSCPGSSLDGGLH